MKRSILTLALGVVTLAALPAHLQALQTTFDVIEKSIPDLQAAMERGAVTSRQLVEIYLAGLPPMTSRVPP